MFKWIKRGRGREDKELAEYRDLMHPPAHFEDGFNWKGVFAALFLGFVMMPGSMYLALVVGSAGSINTAARWVTIILFAEIARRSLKDLKMQEVYILYYMAGLALAAPFQGLLWNQYLIQSDYAQAMGISQGMPSWVAPQPEVIQEAGRTFFTKAWIPAILMASLAKVIYTLDHYGLGYVFYRITSDVEKLPFPMAPVGASGILALAESGDTREPWRWRCFAIGGIIGICFGAVYVAIPAITGSFLPKPLTLIPIPFVDLTPALGKFLPAAPLNICFELGGFISGMVLPFWAIMGSAFGVLFTMLLNPVLFHFKILNRWMPGMDIVDTLFVNNLDFYLSFSIGLTVAITIVSLSKLLKPLLKVFRPYRGPKETMSSKTGKATPSLWKVFITNNVERGDFSILIALGIYVLTSATWILVCVWLIDGFPWPFFVLYAAVYTPTISYACAKLEGLAGQSVTIPMIREAIYILSGYKGVKIWFAPVPIPNYGVQTVSFRVLELTGTKIKSTIKAQLVATPIVIIASLIFSQLLWRMAEVPSDVYPFAQKMWDLQAKNACLMYSSTMEGGSEFFEAWRWEWFGWGIGIGTASFTVLSLLGLPTMFVFGVVRGLGQSAVGSAPLELMGALVGRFYFRKKFGPMWRKYTPVILAGYACGMGLIAMVGMAVAILNKMMSPLLF